MPLPDGRGSMGELPSPSVEIGGVCLKDLRDVEVSGMDSTSISDSA
jgi:hypothetical protein